MASSEHELVLKVIPDMTEVDAEVARRQQPSVGRVVHYVSHGSPVRPDGTQAYTSECRAAIITAVRDMETVPEHEVPYVDLCVLNPTGFFFNQQVLFDEWDSTDVLPGAQPQGCTWHWPERV